MKWVRLTPASIVDLDSDQSQRDDCIQAPDWVLVGDAFDGTTWEHVQSDAASYASALSDGYQDADTGIKLKTTQKAQRDFVAMSALMREGLDLGEISDSTEVTLWDYENNPRIMTTLEARKLLFRYGIYCKSFFDEYAP